jgi:hypothetical protein
MARWRIAAAALCTVLAFSGTGVVSAGASPSDTPARGQASNMGLCSAYLARLGARSDVNTLIREFGPFLPDGPFDSPGELYRIRAKEHPDASAEEECRQRPQP